MLVPDGGIGTKAKPDNFSVSREISFVLSHVRNARTFSFAGSRRCNIVICHCLFVTVVVAEQTLFLMYCVLHSTVCTRGLLPLLLLREEIPRCSYIHTRPIFLH